MLNMKMLLLYFKVIQNVCIKTSRKTVIIMKKYASGDSRNVSVATVKTRLQVHLNESLNKLPS